MMRAVHSNEGLVSQYRILCFVGIPQDSPVGSPADKKLVIQCHTAHRRAALVPSCQFTSGERPLLSLSMAKAYKRDGRPFD